MEKLTDLFYERHDIIHQCGNTSLSKDELKDLLASIEVMKSKLLNEIYSSFLTNFNQR
jgi:hypothetical protein